MRRGDEEARWQEMGNGKVAYDISLENVFNFNSKTIWLDT